MKRKVKVLDHGYVKLIDHMGKDEDIIEAARMSTGKGFQGWEPSRICSVCSTPDQSKALCTGGNPHPYYTNRPGDARLLDFLYRNKHMTPFEMGEMVIEVQAPIMVFREWHRHRTQSYNEFSARYAQMPNLHYVPKPERIAKQSKSNKQGSAEPLPFDQALLIAAKLGEEQADVYDNYDQLIKQGVANEVARVNTPVSRYSKMRAKTDLRNWLGFLLLRMAPNAQWEIQEYANAVAGFIKQLWPRTYALFEEYDLHGIHLSRTERQQLVEFLKLVRPENRVEGWDTLYKKLAVM